MYELKAKQFNGVKVIDSRDVAMMVERNHNELLKTIRNYIGYLNEGDFAQVDFFIDNSYRDSKGQVQPCYLITKKGCDMIANKMTGKKGVLFTAAYVTAFEEMHKAITKPTAALTTSPGGVASLINVYRRIMREQGSTSTEISLMALNIGTAYGIPLPDDFVKEVPGQLTLFNREQLTIGGNVQ